MAGGKIYENKAAYSDAMKKMRDQKMHQLKKALLEKSWFALDLHLKNLCEEKGKMIKARGGGMARN